MIGVSQERLSTPDFRLASARQHYRLPVPADRFRIGDRGEIEWGISLSSSSAPYFCLASGCQHYRVPVPFWLPLQRRERGF
ncbi:hypothetical protein NN561_020262 [Cricetulus griseus]